MSNSRIIGVDIAKDKADIYDLRLQKHKVIEAAHYPQWVKSMASQKPDLVVMEASGGYERDLASQLAAAGIPLAIVNPRQVRDYAKAINHLAKTDSIDARVIALFAEATNVEAKPLPDSATWALSDLVERRRQLTAMRAAESNRKAQAKHPRVKTDIDDTLRFLDGQITKLEADMDREIQNSPVWREAEELLSSVPGVGPVTARVLIAEMPELGQLNREQAASLAGLAPFNDDSGKHQGMRHIQGGRHNVRNALYMATLSAIRHNPYIRRIYQHLTLTCEKPKKPKVALIACMRKLLLLLNSILKNKKTFVATNC